MRMWERTVGEKTEGMGGHRKSSGVEVQGKFEFGDGMWESSWCRLRFRAD